MSVIISTPNETFTYGGTRKFVPRVSGFPLRGIQALHLLQDGSGTALVDARGGTSGLIEAPVATNNAYSWLPALRLEGTQIASFAAFDVRNVWSIATIVTVTASVGGTASERLTALLGFRHYTNTMTGGHRGALLFLRGGNDWSTTTTSNLFQVQVSDGAGGVGTSTTLTPSSGLTVLDQRLLAVMSYNGSSQIVVTLYTMAGVALATATASATDAQITTGTISAVVTNLQPIIGGPSNTYQGGQATYHAFARYDRVLGDADIALLCETGASL